MQEGLTLKVDNHVSSGVVDSLDSLDVESVLEEGGVMHDDEQDNGGQGEVKTVSDSVREDLGQVPVVRGHGRQHSVEGEGHDRSVVLKVKKKG